MTDEIFLDRLEKRNGKMDKTNIFENIVDHMDKNEQKIE